MFTYENHTDRAIIVYMDGKRELALDPGETKKMPTFVRPRRTFEARDENGRTLFLLETTAEQLERAGWRLTITDQKAAPTPPR